MSPEVEIESGRLRGVVVGAVEHFRGVPYARAERFGLPQPVEPWPGVREASAHGPVCPQPASPFASIMGTPEPPGPQHEDCLSLTITDAPHGAASQELIIGTTRDELRSLLESNPRWQRLRRRHALGARFTLGFGALAGRRAFQAPALRLADRRAQVGGAVYTYRLDYRPQGSPLGACHTLDLAFVFGGRAAWEQAPMLSGNWQHVARAGTELRRAWARFAHTGDPNFPGAEPWPVHRPGAGFGRRF